MKLNVTHINYHRKTRVLDVTFNNNEHYEFSAEFLRVLSPSAEVRGHGKGQEKLVTNKKSVVINDVKMVGNYAIQLVFDDKHDSGIYSWDYLHHLGQNQVQLWQDYLGKLKQANANRDMVIPVKIS